MLLEVCIIDISFLIHQGDLYAAGVFLQETLGWDMMTSLIVILLLVLFFTGLGKYKYSNWWLALTLISLITILTQTIMHNFHPPEVVAILW